MYTSKASFAKVYNLNLLKNIYYVIFEQNELHAEHLHLFLYIVVKVRRQYPIPYLGIF